MLGILVKTGTYLLDEPSLKRDDRIHSCLKKAFVGMAKPPAHFRSLSATK